MCCHDGLNNPYRFRTKRGSAANREGEVVGGGPPPHGDQWAPRMRRYKSSGRLEQALQNGGIDVIDLVGDAAPTPAKGFERSNTGERLTLAMSSTTGGLKGDFTGGTGRLLSRQVRPLPQAQEELASQKRAGVPSKAEETLVGTKKRKHPEGNLKGLTECFFEFEKPADVFLLDVETESPALSEAPFKKARLSPAAAVTPSPLFLGDSDGLLSSPSPSGSPFSFDDGDTGVTTGATTEANKAGGEQSFDTLLALLGDCVEY